MGGNTLEVYVMGRLEEHIGIRIVDKRTGRSVKIYAQE